MVLESLINPFKAEKHPWELFFLGLLYSSFAIFISMHIFDTMAGLIAVFFTVMACVPLLYNTMRLEEEKDKLDVQERTLLKEHAKAISFLTFLFLGILVSFTLWYVFLPSEQAQNFFSIQIDTIKSINSNAVSGAVPGTGLLLKIFLNNVKVLIFCILFSFFYGAGAIFILTWNASVIAAATGNFIREHLASLATNAGMLGVGAYFQAVSMGFLRYMIHGIPEILAYFVAGLAGGIISVAVVNHDFYSGKFEKILFDSANLVIIGIAILFAAAILEVYVTPVFF
jgi:uncharacterized membrane protein SpoIIM required for sporulation